MADAAGGRRSGEGRTSPWLWVAGGCGCLLLGGGISVIALTAYCTSTVRRIEAEVRDPARRAERVRDVLGSETMPEGYYPAFGVSVPFVVELAVITDREPDEEMDFDGPVERAFFYARLSSWMRRDRDLRDVLEGRADPGELFDKTDVRTRADEAIGEGTITVGEQEVRYASQRGDVWIENHRLEGVFALVVVDCPSGRPGVGGWLTPDPDPASPIEAIDFAGTAADPVALAAFLAQFRLCR